MPWCTPIHGVTPHPVKESFVGCVSFLTWEIHALEGVTSGCAHTLALSNWRAAVAGKHVSTSATSSACNETAWLLLLQPCDKSLDTDAIVNSLQPLPTEAAFTLQRETVRLRGKFSEEMALFKKIWTLCYQWKLGHVKHRDLTSYNSFLHGES